MNEVSILGVTVKIKDKDKRELDLLQAEFTLKLGRKITQQELLSKILDFIETSKEEFFSKFASVPLSDKQLENFKRLQSDWGVITTEKEIDVVLYG